ncbi:MAG: type II/IV secretion system protein [Candidatus Latescibacteria bacterium]|nr:type II/IV secretion system protein [Candidatus Latescibacterota bacterium]NIM66487.1 type II/IV secretion system protein [Candidatus Latescibacterota bacterium]NIO02967.1 type II/IV secretion system protein [Candidatus Latescibacterota bacterium]NIO30102.1 type II/IV secretion system protein [Candidatus Latescibacterota bacterium]NIO57721.1 type II/IV secretion system protein [Candidatus Latescibacterota bacterium]
MRENQHNASLESDFTLEAVAGALGRSGFLSLPQIKEISKSSVVKRAHLRNKLKTKESDKPFVSPVEIIAEFGFPSTNPRRDQMDEAEICEALSRTMNVPFVRIDPLKLDVKSVCSIVSKPFARKHLLVPIKIKGGALTVAMVNPFDREMINSLEDVTGCTVVPVLGMRSEILKTINEVFAFEHSLMKAEKLRDAGYDLGNLEQLAEMMTEEEIDASDKHIIKAVDLLFQYAYEQRASDIHLEPKRDKGVVRLRIDGRLHDTHSIPKKIYPSFVSRIKIMARMDIAEKRKPQDGRIKTSSKDAEVELRVSIVPVAFGEKIVIRIFDPSVLMQDLSSLGFFPDQLEAFQRFLHRPYGIILVTGPTGSGKTTTLYSALRYLSNPEVNITTIEDPIEMIYEPFNQIAVQSQIGITFSTALRNVLRQDPDIIMVGEIRDRETAEYAIQAALTGHLVLTTLHTNNAVGAVTRLTDLGVEPFLIASTALGVIAQRLVRMVCKECDVPAQISEEEKRLLCLEDDVDLSNLRAGKGCEKCRNTGYKGRTGVYEVLEATEEIRLLVRDCADEKDIERAARRSQMRPLLSSAIENLIAGKTTVEEILRVVPLAG